MARQGARYWRLYRDSKGRSPVDAYLDGLNDDDAAKLVAAMNLAARGIRPPKKLRSGGGEIHEVVCRTGEMHMRVLMAFEGRNSQVMLALDAFTKKGVAMQDREIGLAASRLADWRERGRLMRTAGATGREGPRGAPRPHRSGLIMTARQALRGGRDGLA